MSRNKSKQTTKDFVPLILNIQKITFVTMIVLYGAIGIETYQCSAAGHTQNSSNTKILHFPADRATGRLYVESLYDSSSSVDPTLSKFKHDIDWEYIGLARGDQLVPVNRKIRLILDFGTEIDDLSCLEKLSANDLYELSIISGLNRRSANRLDLEAISHLTGLRALRLSSTNITGKQLSVLKSLASLRALTFSEEKNINSNSLIELRNLPALEYLDCGTYPTDIGIKHISQLPDLRWLRIRMGRVRGPGLVYLADLPHLEHLTLWGTSGISDRQVRYLEVLKHLKSLKLWGGNSTLSDASLASISKLTALEELYFIRIKTNFTDAAFGQLAALTQLRVLGTAPQDAAVLAGMKQLESIRGITLNSKNMKALTELSNLKSLDLILTRPGSNTEENPSEWLSKLKSLEKIRVIGVMYGESFGDMEMAALESLSHLKELRVPLGDISEQSWISIGKMKQLKSLDISVPKKNNVSIHNLNHLNGLINLEKLHIDIPVSKAPLLNDTPLNWKALTKLKYINLISVHLQESDWAFLADQQNLEELWLNNCSICTENGLKFIKDLPKLKALDLQNVDCVKANGLAFLGGLTNLRSIRILGRVTDRALQQFPSLPLLLLFTVNTDVIIRPDTIARLQQILPSVRNVTIQQPHNPASSMRFGQ